MAVLNAEYRSPGEETTEKLLNGGILPIDFIEKGKGATKIQCPLEALRKALAESRGVGLFDLKIRGDGQLRHVIVKRVLKDDESQRVKHLTLQEISDDDRIQVHVPVTPKGRPRPTTTGSAVLTNVNGYVRVKGRLAQLPDKLAVDVDHLDLHECVCAKDLDLPKGVELLTAEDTVLFELRPTVSNGSGI
jgi:large subunit ribosomal protein L25